MSQIRVAVLYGGRSVEHDVSLLSAQEVIAHLDRKRFAVIPVKISKEGSWCIEDASGSNPISMVSISEICDVVFSMLHGRYGEDGCIQGFLEVLGVPYVGSGVLASSISMDKDITKRLAQAAGIPVLPFLTVRKSAFIKNQSLYAEMALQKFDLPVFVKPANGGSSLGIQKVKQSADLIPALTYAFTFDVKAFIEPAIVAREIEVSVLGGVVPLVSCPGEIIPHPKHEFYSYTAKYLDDSGAQLIIPANIKNESELQATAKEIFTLLGCAGMARVDFFLDEKEQLFFNEINTIPGFTKISMYPKLWESSGLSYTELLTRLIELAIDEK
jgi:D-alanine-D-alanine ligase